MMRGLICAGSYAAVALFLLGVSASQSLADTVRLNDGRVLKNVKTIPRGKYQFIISQNGRVLRVRNSEIQALKVHPVRWRRGMQSAQVQRFVDRRIQHFKEKLKRDLRRQIRKEFAAERKRKAALAQRKLHEEQARRGRMWRSLMLPGWSQYRQERKPTAYLHGGLFALAVLQSWSSYQSFSQARAEYEDTSLAATLVLAGGVAGAATNLLLFQERRATMERSRTLTVRYLFLATAIAGWSALDAFNSDPGAGRKPLVSLGLTPAGVGMAMRLRVDF